MSPKTTLKVRLSVMNLYEFAVWGSYLVSLGIFLNKNGLGSDIPWFYTVQGLVSLFMPGLIGIAADRWIPAQKMLSLCHLLAGIFMILAGWQAYSAISAGIPLEFGPMFTYYTLSVAFFMPTIGLCNSVSFNALTKAGLDTVKDFPPIRVLGTVGFIVAELFVNFTQFQETYMQLFTSGIVSLLLMVYALTLPACPVNAAAGGSLAEKLGLNAFKLFKRKKMAIFFIFSMLLGVSLQITNSYGTTFIETFKRIPEFANDWAAENATALTSLSQASEALCILAIPFCLKRFGIKGVMLMAMFSWVLRFGFFGLGNTGSGVIFLILSCIVYGVAFDFFNVSGGLFVDKETDPKLRSSAQGLFMIMTNGIGASVGTFIAGNEVINKLVFNAANGDNAALQLPGWRESWFIFAAYALVVAVLFFFIFHDKHEKGQLTHSEMLKAEDTESGADGFVNDRQA